MYFSVATNIERVFADRSEVEVEVSLQKDLIHVEEGTRAIDHNWVFVARDFCHRNGAFADEKYLVAVRRSRLDNCTML